MSWSSRWRLAALVAVCVAGLSAPEGASQKARRGVEFRLDALSGADAVMLLITDPLFASKAQGGYDIYRRGEREQAFQRINESPLARADSLRGIEIDDELLALGMVNVNLRQALGLVYWDDTVEDGETYTYYVQRVAVDEQQSEPSPPVSVTAGVLGYELKGPADVRVQREDTVVTITWKANPEDANAFSYVVRRALSPEGPYFLQFQQPVFVSGSNIDGTARGVFADTAVVQERTYYYKVLARDLAGNESDGAYLAAAPADITPPSVPQGVAAVPSGLGVTVSWRPVTDRDVAGYNLYRSHNADSSGYRINDYLLPADALHSDSLYFEDRAAAPKVEYFYRVSSVDHNGNESQRSARAVNLFPNMDPPLPPQRVRATGRDRGIFVEWDASSDVDSLRGYLVFRYKLGGDTVQVSHMIQSDTTFFHDTDPHLSTRGKYWYRVKALSFTGVKSPFSGAACAGPELGVPPQTTTAFWGDHDARGNRLFWIPSPDVSAVGFHVYRAVAADPRWVRLTTGPVSARRGAYVDSEAEYMVEYSYRIRPVNRGGEEGDPTRAINLIRFEPAPLPPGKVMIFATDNGLKIAWDASLQPRVKSYVVYRRTEGQPGVKEVPVTTTSYDDPDVGGGRYFYSVACVTKGGRVGPRSGETAYLTERGDGR